MRVLVTGGARLADELRPVPHRSHLPDANSERAQ